MHPDPDLDPDRPAIVTRALAASRPVPSGPPVRALRGISIAIERGALVAVVGPAGAGKSTLLLVLAGALAPDAGSVLVDGRDPRELRRRRVPTALRRRAMPAGRRTARGSVGERRRAQITAVAARAPRLLLADAPLAGLDEAAGDDVLERLVDLARGGGTVVITTTDPRVAARCGRSVALVGGRVVGTFVGATAAEIERALADARRAPAD